ncbi:MAG TPA: alpha/beta hydrolase, partial [Acidimicrobiales bacterium]
MAHDVSADRRIDPRIKALLGALPDIEPSSATTREQLVAEANTPEAIEGAALFAQFMDLCDTEDAAPSTGLRISTEPITSVPDGNSINLRIIRPVGDDVVACVYYIHGGGMTNLSCFDGMYRGWGKLIAANGVAVVMVDFRNALSPSSVPEVAPYPAGLNDCVSGFHWVVDHAGDLGIDPDRIVIAGESGGGNLTLATGMRLLRDGEVGKVKGLYALCPYIAGEWPQEQLASTYENNGILLDLHGSKGALAYGIEAFEA